MDEGDVASGVETKDGPPTLIPAFDPSKYAEEFEVRDRLPTVTDEVALEQARLASLPSRPPGRGLSTKPPAALDDEPWSVEIDAEEADLEALDPDAQIALLRARLAPLGRVAALARPLTELGPVLQDPKTAYVLGFVDGILPLETVLDVAGLPELDTLRILDHMIDQGVVLFRKG